MARMVGRQEGKSNTEKEHKHELLGPAVCPWDDPRGCPRERQALPCLFLRTVEANLSLGQFQGRTDPLLPLGSCRDTSSVKINPRELSEC